MANILTAADRDLLEEVVAPLQENYDGPPLGTRHEYPPTKVHRMHGIEPPEWLIEERKKERARAWAARDYWHARAMALTEHEPARHDRVYDYETALPPRRRRARYGIAIHCPCGHRGHVMLGDRPRPWKLRCSQCGEAQEL